MMMRIRSHNPNPGGRGNPQLGTTLLEMLVAVAMFTLVSGAAFSLFRTQQQSSLNQQSLTALSLGLRNATSQLQMDLANAGNGYLQAINISSWPTGVVIVNNFVQPGQTCYNSSAAYPASPYTASCFDSLNVIMSADPQNVPSLPVTDSTGGSGSGNCSDTSTGVAYGQPGTLPLPLPAGTPLTAAATAALFAQGDQVMFIDSTGKLISTAVLTQAPTASSVVKFQFNPTNGDGSNSQANDPLDLTTCNGHLSNPVVCPAIAASYTNRFCPGGWIVKLAAVKYKVQQSNPYDPINPWQLVRTQQNGTSSVVMDQIIGFKLGATLYNGGTGADFNVPYYYYDSSQYTITTPTPTPGSHAYEYSLVRSVRVSIIGRTTPDPTNPYRNTFDQGSYQVSGSSIVVNPRNLTMNDK